MKKYDLAIIGGGPGGYVAAIRAAQLGMQVVLIEKEQLGGVCLNWGCIPTKSLLKSAELFESMQKSEHYGISAKTVSFDIKKIVARSEEVSTNLVQGIQGLMKKNQIQVINGQARIVNSNKIDISGKEQIEFKNLIIATGARARVLKGFEPNDKNIWTYREALKPKKLPKSMVIVGSGAIGIEFACFYNSFGVDVTVLEAQKQILPVEDAEISAAARKIFEQKGIKFKTSIELLKQEAKQNKVKITYKEQDKEHHIESEILLMAVGIVGNIEDIGLENTKVKTNKNHIVTDGCLQTADSNIYAIGDVAGAPWLAHKASHEGIIAVEKIAGLKPHAINKQNIPGCTYSNPQIASVGLTEQAAKEAGYELKIGGFPSYGNGKSLIIDQKDGIVKTIFDAKTGELLGAHMLGKNVTELIHGFTIHRQLEGTELDLFNTIFPHPTLSEMMHESALKAFNRALHI